MDAVSEWNVENGRPILDKWCATGYGQYSLYNKLSMNLLHGSII